MYKMVFTDQAIKDLEALRPAEKQRIASKLQQSARDPKQYARKLIDSRLGDYRFRIGDYRVIFDIEGHHLILLRIGLRKDIDRR